jgi:flagellar hook-associated protein 2
MAGTISTTTGLASGTDWSSLIDQMINAEKAAKVTPLTVSKTAFQTKLSAWQSFNTMLSNVANYVDVNKLNTTDGYKLYTSSLSGSDSSVTPSSILSASLSTPSGPGTYAIEVTNLAQAQKISSDPFASKTIALGFSGDIVVNGHRVTIQAADTLTAVRDRINGANAGVTASILSTSSTSNMLVLESATTGVAGISLKNGSGADLLESLNLHTGTTQLVYPSGSDATSDTYSSETGVIGTILGLTSAQTGTIRIKGTDDVWNDVTVNLGTDSLDTIAATINTAAPAGVTASVEQVVNGTSTTYRLKLTNVDVSDLQDQNNILETLGVVGGTNKTVVRAGGDATLKIDGNAITSKSNSVVGVIEGVTLNLTGMNEGKPIQLSISQDNSTVTQKASTLVQNVNTALNYIKAQNTYSSDSSTSGSTATPLLGDINLSTIRNKISSIVFAEVSGNETYKTLSSIGISFAKDGSLSVTTGTLNNALSTNGEETLNVLKTFSDSLYSTLNVYVDPYTGTLNTIKKSIQSSMANIDKRITEANERIDRERVIMEKKFNALEVLISQSNSIKNWLTQQTDYMTGKNK